MQITSWLCIRAHLCPIRGKMKAQFPDEETKAGEFKRQEDAFREWISNDGSTPYAAEAGRYHLYVSLACPWAHRTVIFRKLKGLENVISLSVVSPDMLKDGWTFNKDEGSSGDTVNGKSKLSEIYLLT